jgi:hypothetical protein
MHPYILQQLGKQHNEDLCREGRAYWSAPVRPTKGSRSTLKEKSHVVPWAEQILVHSCVRLVRYTATSLGAGHTRRGPQPLRVAVAGQVTRQAIGQKWPSRQARGFSATPKRSRGVWAGMPSAHHLYFWVIERRLSQKDHQATRHIEDN